MGIYNGIVNRNVQGFPLRGTVVKGDPFSIDINSLRENIYKNILNAVRKSSFKQSKSIYPKEKQELSRLFLSQMIIFQ